MAIERKLLNDIQRLTSSNTLFGILFPMRLEPAVYRVTSAICRTYNGGYWDFFALSHGGFYLAPHANRAFPVICDNGFEGTLSPDALGITACLYAYSHLSFSSNQDVGQMFARHYHLLWEYMLEHAEAPAILRAID